MRDSAAVADELHLLLTVAAGKLYGSADPREFLDWIALAGPALAPQLSQNVDPATGPISQFFRALGVHIYNVTPLPAYQFTLHPLPKPQRNEPCICGSGKKYKHCCISTDMAAPLGDFNMLAMVLAHAPNTVLAQLPKSKVDTGALADVAQQWFEDGQEKRALAVLEPWFKPSVALDRRHRPLFDLIMHIYLELGNPLKRKRLVARVCEASDKMLRSDGWQRRATMAMDAGDSAEAWASFTIAQQLDPNTPSIAFLELTLLCADQQFDQAKARATFWLARFRRDPTSTPEMLETLAECAKDPALVFSRYATEASNPQPIINLLYDLLRSGPEIAAHYTLQEHKGVGFMLEPTPNLVKLERRWFEVTQVDNTNLTPAQNENWSLWSSHESVSLLAKFPLLLNSFDVLHDLVFGVEALAQQNSEADGLLDIILRLLLVRASHLLELQIESTGKKSVTLPWLMMENRTALGLLAHKIFLQTDEEGFSPDVLAEAERLLALNPNDNHGIREHLSTGYLSRAQLDKVIAIAKQFPDDVLCTVPLNKLLALKIMGRNTEATAQLKQVKSRFKVAIDMLLAKRPRAPALSEYGVQIGGKDEAWLYRNRTLSFWKKSGALDWLRQQLRP